jgi:hypothetical protein
VSRPSVFVSPAERERFVDDVLGELGARYLLDDGTEVEGQAISYLRIALSSRCYGSTRRSGRWRGLSRYGTFVDGLREAGFRVERGRGYRYFRGGVYKPGTPCDVVTL